MERRMWEDLPEYCLVNVFRRVGMETLLLDVPFVCKSWYKATLNPLCWERLDFYDIMFVPKDDCFYRFYDVDGVRMVHKLMDEYGIKEFSAGSMIKFLVNRSNGKCTVLNLPADGCKEEVFKFVIDKCPALRCLSFSCDLFKTNYLPIIQELIEKCKYLEFLTILDFKVSNLKEIVAKIGLNCKNLWGFAAPFAYIGEEEAAAIVTTLPHISYLILKHSLIDRKYLVEILHGCKRLFHLDVSNCSGFKIDDKLLKLASHIHTFKYEGVID
ncbi:F-box protein FBW2-like [Hevea brasiliensis]|uniref:F-box protein FBW2-like n=1 Tax=Hevea brasiliensis TaxID=3981 RepID=UPI0025D57514|nr:F-box protein FBW2-like [Hevea brasiliensis]